MKGEGGPAGGAAASTVRLAAKLTKRVDAARVGVPGLRKTVATLDAALSPTEIDEVSWTELVGDRLCALALLWVPCPWSLRMH